MPVFKLNELQSIGKYLLDRGCIAAEMKADYSPDRIEERFEEFGGIFRIVLPHSMKFVQQCKESKRALIRDCDATQLLTLSDIEDPRVSHLLMQYDIDPSEGISAFSRPAVKFVSSDVEKQLKKKVLEVDLRAKINALLRNDETGHFDDIAPSVYESVVGELLTKGVQWKKKVRTMNWGATSKTSDEDELPWEDFDFTIRNRVEGFQTFAEMGDGDMCVPQNSSFRFVEFYLKRQTGNGEELVLFQVTRQDARKKTKVSKKVFTKFAMISCFQKIGLEGEALKNVKLRLVLIPSPSRADNMIFSPEHETKTQNNPEKVKWMDDCDKMSLLKLLQEKLTTYEVWKVPFDYSTHFEDSGEQW